MNKPRQQKRLRPQRLDLRLSAWTVVLVTVLAMALNALPLLDLAWVPVPRAEAAGVLRIELDAGYNVVVDSNVTSASTYAPAVATVFARFCNTGDAALTNVMGYIGNYNTLSAGIYPARNSADPGFIAEHPALANTGSYAFTHVGGRMGAADARRFMGTIQPGECKTQYWHLTYPQCRNVWNGSQWVANAPPCDEPGSTGTWGNSVKPEDDLWLQFDIWGTSDQSNARAINAPWTMTMRNEISAMANKIRPHPDGQWFNTKTDTIEPGGLITTNGILYTLGNTRFGFDNDKDYVPDYNAWLQPIGDPSYDPSCFRIVRVSSVLTVTRSAGKPDLILHTSDLAPHPVYGGPLYFTNLPPDNTNTRGLVYYTFQAQTGPCQAMVSPYQEVASGYDNEKFNGDYGTGVPPQGSVAPKATIDKTASPNIIPLGSTTTYRIPFANTGETPVGLGLSSGGTSPLVISDTVPNGLQYVGGSATYNLAYTPNTGVTRRYSTDSGLTWSGSDPGNRLSTWPNSKVIIQWWLNDALPAGSTGSYAQYQATVPAGYTGAPFIDNCAEGSLGLGVPFDRACAMIMIQGNNKVGDWVWRDENTNAVQDDGATGINAIAVSLYWDKNGDGKLDANDVFLQTMDTYAYLGANGYYTFTNLPDANYLVVVDTADANLPTGYGLTTPRVRAAALDPGGSSTQPVVNRDADFGFGPALKLQKTLTSENPSYEGDLVTYRIALMNNLPGDGTGNPAACTYMVYAQHNHPYSGSDIPKSSNNPPWQNEPYALYAPDSLYATLQLNSNNDDMGLGAFDTASQVGNITKVELVAYAREIVDFKGGSQKDALLLQPWYNNVGLTGQTYDSTYFTRTAPADYVIVRDITSLRSWTWSDFSADRTELLVEGQKGNQSPYGQIGIDAVAYRITTDQACGEPDGTIDPLPLTDTFDNAKLQFISASPPQSSVAGGTITWNNVGPLYPGQTKYVSVTFKALPIAGSTPISHQNCGNVSGAYFLNGRPVNDAQSCVTHNINPTARIGDLIWNDQNSNGVFDTGEQPIPNVRVYLCAGSVTTCNAGNAIQTTWTDANGLYYFDGVRDGTWTVGVDTSTLPPGWTRTYDFDGTVTPDRSVTTVANAVDDLRQDFGYRFPAYLYGNVWEDADGDSNKETGDTGIPGVTVYLCTSTPCTSANAIQTKTTDANGNYLFGNLTGGTTYYVGIANTLAPLGADWINTRDPEGAPGNHQFAGVTVAAGRGHGSYDFGYYRTGTYQLGDTVYTDWNGNAAQDPGEEGLPNITVWLYEDDDGDGIIDPEDGLVATTVTDANGNYLFSNRGAGSYIVVVDRDDPDFPGGYRQTQDPDQDGMVCTACDSRGRATLGPNDLTVDFGYQPFGSASIGDLVWRDLDRDGVQDGGAETGIANITVNLYEDSNGNGVIDAADALVATTSTDANGNYLFSNLRAGRYLVDVDTTDPQLPLDGYGNRYVLSTNNDPLLVVLSAGQDYRDADFGFTPGGLIGDTIYQDTDADGQQDIGEPGIAGVTVRLYRDVDGDGTYETLVGTDVSDANGIYEFPSLPEGDYRVVVDTGTLPSGYTQTGDPDLTGPCSGGSCDSRSDLYLYPGQVDRTRDFGYRPANLIGDYLWIDADGDGVQDSGEAGIPYITVYLYANGPDGLPGTADDVLWGTTATDGDGKYAFAGMPDGGYNVRVDTNDPDWPGGLVQTYDPDSTCPGGGCNSRGDTAVGPGNRTVTTVDFGYRYDGPNSIAGTVFYDADNDAVQDPGETYGYAGVTVYLYNAQGRLIGTTVTDANGNYSFPNLPDGNYTVSYNPESPELVGLSPTNTSNPTTFRSVALDPGGTDPNPVNVGDQDFGVISNIDAGDLPNSYNTLLASDGPRHVIGSLYLGSGVDADPNGLPTTDALGDDNTGIDDENGIAYLAGGNWAPGTTYRITATVSAAGGYLVAFFDWNEDGDFADAGEVLDLGATTAGSNVYNRTVPSGATMSAYVNARFRLFAGRPLTLSPQGLAYNGEVEDYKWPIGITAVKLLSFTARPQARTIVVAWETATEHNNAGFHLYRRQAGTQEYARINMSLIPSSVPGGNQGAGYTFLDGEVLAGVTYEYMLEDVDWNGTRTPHGPVAAAAPYTVFFPLIVK